MSADVWWEWGVAVCVRARGGGPAASRPNTPVLYMILKRETTTHSRRTVDAVRGHDRRECGVAGGERDRGACELRSGSGAASQHA